MQGVKGISIIDVLPTFDTVKGFTPEYMHSMCQGVIRQICNLWLDSGNHEEDFYLGRKVQRIDQRLLTISPPSEITRAPRTLKDRNGILPAVYLKHFFLLVFGVYTLLGDNIEDDMLLYAHASLMKFV